MSAGEVFGEMAGLDEMPRSADVIALDAVLIACMPAAAFHRLLNDEPQLATRMLRRLASMVRKLTQRVIDLSTLGVQNRIHAELLRLAREAGIDDNKARIDPAPKHADIASQVSTNREQVTRELSRWPRRASSPRTTPACWWCATSSSWRRWSKRSGTLPRIERTPRAIRKNFAGGYLADSRTIATAPTVKYAARAMRTAASATPYSAAL